MAGPTEQQTQQWVIPPGEAQVQFAPSALAWKVQNFEETPEGTLKSIRGPAPYERAGQQGYYALGEPHGIFHAILGGGQVDMLLVRAGPVLYRHAGWNRTWESLQTGLNDDRRATWPDQFVLLDDKIIWCNGVDTPLIVGRDAIVTPLGFNTLPSAPQVDGPVQPEEYAKDAYFPNSKGYSWPGRIGTAGDFMQSETGTLLPGAWYYAVQWEDMYGNLSAVSPLSNPFILAEAQAIPAPAKLKASYDNDEAYTTCTINDLLRQSLVRLSGGAPDNAVALRLLRTENTKRTGTKPRLLTRFNGTDILIYPDQAGDSELGGEVRQNWVVAPWRVMCTHQGSLVVGNIVGDPGKVRRSEPGFFGTFPLDDWTYPDAGAAEVTGLVSHLGKLLAFTDTCAYDLQDFGNPVPIGHGTGCAAPRSIQSMLDGSLIWLGRDGFYRLDGKGIARISDPIHDTIQYGINRGRMRLATATIDPVSREYRCCIGKAGSNRQTMTLCYGQNGWRRMDFEGIHLADICTTQDWRRYLLAVGRDLDLSTNLVYAMDREVDYYTPPTRHVIYRSGWLRADKTASIPVFVRTMYIGMVDAWNDSVVVRFYKNGSWNPVHTNQALRAVGIPKQSIANQIVIGTDKTVANRLFWRQVPLENNMQDCFTWAFEIRCDYPAAAVHLAAFAFDTSLATTGNTRAGRIPRAGDV